MPTMLDLNERRPSEILATALKELDAEYRAQLVAHYDKEYIEESYDAAFNALLNDYTRFIRGKTLSSILTHGAPHQKMIYELLKDRYVGYDFDYLKNQAELLFKLFAEESDKKNFKLEESGVEPWEQLVHLTYLVKAYNCLVSEVDAEKLAQGIWLAKFDEEIRRTDK